MYIVYIILLIISAIVWSTAGFGLGNWEYWVLLGCIIGAHICGREERRK